MPHGPGAGNAQAIFLDRFRFVQESLNRIRNYVAWDNGAVAVTEASEPGRRRAKALGWLIWLSLVGVPKLVPCLTWHTELRQFAMRNFCDRYLIPWLGAVSVRVPVLLDGVPQVLGPAPDDAQWLAPLLSVLESLATGHVQASQVRRTRPKLTTVHASELQWEVAAAPWTLAECVVLYELLLRRLDRLALDCLKSLQRDVYSNATNIDGNVDDLHSSYRQMNVSPLESPGRSAAKEASRLGRQPALSASVEGTTLKRENSAVFDAEIRDRWKRHQGPSRQPIHPTAYRSDCRHEAEADAPASAALGNEANTMNGSGHASSSALGLYESVASGADEMESLPEVWTPSALDGADALENAAPYAHALRHNIGVLVWQLVTGVETCLPVHDGTLANTSFTPVISARHAHSSQQRVTERQVLEESVSVAPKSNPHRHVVTARAQRKRPPERLIKTSKQQTSTAGKQNSSDPSIGMLDGWRFPLARRSAYGHLAAVLALLRQIRDSDGALAACVAHRSMSSSAVSMLRRLLEIWQSESNHAGVAALSPHLSTMQNADTDTAELSMNLETLYAVLIAILRGAAHEFGHHLLQIRSHQAASSSTGNGDGLVEETRSLQQHLEQLLCDILRTSEHRNLRDSAGINRTSSGSIGHNSSLVPMLQAAILGVQAIMSQLEEHATGPARQKRESHHLTDIVSESTMPGLLPALQERNASVDSASALATPSTRVHRRQDNSAKHPIAQVLLQIAERRGVDAFLAAFDRFAAKAQSRWLETLEAILRTQRPSDRGIWPTVTWYRALFELGCVMNTAARVDGKRLLEAFWSHCAPCPVLDEQCDPAMLVAALRSYLNGFATERSVYPGMSSARDESSEGGELPELRQLTEALLSRLAANAYRPRKAPQEASWSVADSLFMNALAPTLQPPCAWSTESSAFGSQVTCVETGSARGHSQPWFAVIEEFALWIPMSSLARSLQQHIRTGLLSLSANHTDAETFTEQCTWLVDVLQAVDRGLATQNAFCRSSASSIEVEPQQCPLFDECFVNQLACGCEPQLRADSPPEATVSRSMTNPTARHGSPKRCHGTREVVLALAERLTPMMSAGPPTLSPCNAFLETESEATGGRPERAWARDKLPALYIEARPLRACLVWLYLRALCIWKRTPANQAFRARCLKTLSALYSDPATAMRSSPLSHNTSDGSYLSPSAALRLLNETERTWGSSCTPVAANATTLATACTAAFALWLHDGASTGEDWATLKAGIRHRLWRWELVTFSCEQHAFFQLNSAADLERFQLWRSYLRHVFADDHRCSLTTFMDGTLGGQLQDALMDASKPIVSLACLPSCLVIDMARAASNLAERVLLRELFWKHLYMAAIAGGASSRLDTLPDASFCESVLINYTVILGNLEPALDELLTGTKRASKDEQQGLNPALPLSRAAALLGCLSEAQQRWARNVDTALELWCHWADTGVKKTDSYSPLVRRANELGASFRSVANDMNDTGHRVRSEPSTLRNLDQRP